jgi:hypothetical protein
MTHLSLPGAVDLLDVMKILFDGGAVGHRLQNLVHLGREAGAKNVTSLASSRTRTTRMAPPTTG